MERKNPLDVGDIETIIEEVGFCWEDLFDSYEEYVGHIESILKNYHL